MINVTFETLDEMLLFAERLSGLGQSPSPMQVPQATQDSPTIIQQVISRSQPTQATPDQTSMPQASIHQSPVVSAPIQTSTVNYTMDDLSRAAMALMDSGRQGDLLGLLSQFGADSLPSLPVDQYGAFATALRGMGAQI